jgi:hypothetical protein
MLYCKLHGAKKENAMGIHIAQSQYAGYCIHARKIKITNAMLLLLVLLSMNPAHALDRIQLKEFRTRFINQRVFINGNFIRESSAFLINWQFVEERKGIYEANDSKKVPLELVGRSGIIIAVQAPVQPGKVTDQSDNAFVQYAIAIVKLDSGDLLQSALYADFLESDPGSHPGDPFTPASVREKHKAEAEALAKRLAGKSLFLTRVANIYDMSYVTSNTETLKAGVAYPKAQITNFPLLTPIPILEVRYATEGDFTLVAIQLPDGRKAFYVPGCIANDITYQNILCVSTSMPSFLTEREKEAIRKGGAFTGMSEDALYMALGFPRKRIEDTSALGHTQLMYLTGYVSIDKNRKIVGIQNHN